jgi:glutamine amidotransferase
VSISVGIIDYQAGNIRSISNAFESLGVDVSVVSRPDSLKKHTHLVLPGVGAFGYCAARLRESGLQSHLNDWIFDLKRPLLGICVGMQLCADFSEEHGRHEGLGWIGGKVQKLNPEMPSVRIPHVGWNTVVFQKDFGRFRCGEEADFYFDHSYAFMSPTTGITIGSCNHGLRFSAVVQRDCLLATQFHPEKSQEAGKRFLSSFLEMV